MMMLLLLLLLIRFVLDVQNKIRFCKNPVIYIVTTFSLHSRKKREKKL